MHPHSDKPEIISTYAPYSEYYSGTKFYLALITSRQPWENFNNAAPDSNISSQDSTIVATAIPYITDEFHSLKDVGWYGSFHLMAVCMSQFLYGKLSARYSIRWIDSTAVFLFLVGSAICGAAPSSPALIAGRAIAGLGSSGLLVTVFSLVPILGPPTKRPIILTLNIIARSLASTAGPLGGTIYAWRNARMIALLVIFGLLGLAFIVIEIWQGQNAFYLPEWFQGVKGASPFTSAVQTLPWLITSVLILLVGGAVIAKPGHPEIWMLVGSAFGAVGSGLFTTFKIDIRTDKWIGYQIILAIGSALFSVTTIMVVQAALTSKDVPIGSSMSMFAQTMGSTIFLSVGQALFTNNLAHGLQRLGIERLHPNIVSTSGLLSLTTGLPPDTKMAVLGTINNALVDSWRLSMVLTCISVVGAMPVQHHGSKSKGHGSG
ncbi:hypothetical protein H106_02186 [Trichophyton rubrum CBS 735.88]|nr:hypothetical protein H106_02186 [Trichophyton rubrum CBS 735.88]